MTWVEQHLDSVCYQHVRNWLGQPISSCVKEVAVMPKSRCGLDVPSFRDTFERLWMKKRHKLKHSMEPEIQQIWKDSSYKNITVDSYLNDDVTATSALSSLRDHQELTAQTHLFSLNIQGLIVKSVTESISRQNITDWSSSVETMPQYIFNFARKALIQQLPTASNLHRWKKIASSMCNLCSSDKVQTNKHVLNNCDKALERYTQRHDNVLSLLANWILTVKSVNQELLVDLPSEKWQSIVQVFQPTCRPDIVVIGHSRICVLELTICHETNLVKSKNYKINKYNNIRDQLQSAYVNYDTHVFTLEISSLGFIGDFNDFRNYSKLPKLPKSIRTMVIKSVLNDSYNIYRMRNSEVQ